MRYNIERIYKRRENLLIQFWSFSVYSLSDSTIALFPLQRSTIESYIGTSVKHFAVVFRLRFLLIIINEPYRKLYIVNYDSWSKRLMKYWSAQFICGRRCIGYVEECNDERWTTFFTHLHTSPEFPLLVLLCCVKKIFICDEHNFNKTWLCHMYGFIQLHNKSWKRDFECVKEFRFRLLIHEK